LIYPDNSSTQFAKGIGIEQFFFEASLAPRSVKHVKPSLPFQDMVGKQVDAELYKLPDGQLRASHVRVSRPVLENVDDEGMPALEGQADEDPEP